MKYNPVTNTIDRADGTPYLHLEPCIGAQEAYHIADTLLQAPEWEKEKEELEEEIENLKCDLRHRENLAASLETSEKQAGIFEDQLEASQMYAGELETELTQARLHIEELETMLAACEAARESELREPV
jgi:predicted RNase H-like nuclease (RuvC/YqgF family)